jgi:hypothetical protein
MRSLRALFLSTTVLHAAVAHAQGSGVVPNAPLYKVEVRTSTDSGVFANIFAIHVLSDGRVIATDANRRRLLLIDSSLKKFTVVADTAGEGKTPYGNSQGGLIQYVGDSAAFVDQASGALVTVDAKGNMGRITTLPNLQDIRFLGGPAYGKPGFDVKGRLFYRSVLPYSFTPMTRDGRDTITAPPDTAPVLRADLDTRRIDTLGWVHVAAPKQKTYRFEAAGMGMVTTTATIVNPIPVLDDWAYDRDGTVAIVRGHDYHIDWVLPDGSKKSTGKMPMNWLRITDDGKKHIVDSVFKQLDSLRTAMVERNAAAAAAAGRGRGPSGYVPPPTMLVEPKELPDYHPAVRANSRPRFDLDGNLWVIPGTATAPTPGAGLLYDVIDRTGTVIKRVLLPPGRILSNFDKAGNIYLVVPTTTAWTRIERGPLVKQ